MVLEQIVSKTGDITTTCTETEVIVVIVTEASFMNTPQASEVLGQEGSLWWRERGFIETFQDWQRFVESLKSRGVEGAELWTSNSAKIMSTRPLEELGLSSVSDLHKKVHLFSSLSMGWLRR